MSGCIAPCTGLEHYAIDGACALFRSAGAMRIHAGSVDVAITYLKILARLYHSYAVARRIEAAIIYLHPFPISSGYGIVAGANVAILYHHVFATSYVHSIPAFFDAQTADFRVNQLVAKHGIIGRTLDVQSLYLHILAFSNNYGVRTTHRLFAERIHHMAAVDGAFAAHYRIFHSHAENKRFGPTLIRCQIGISSAFAGVVARHVAGWLVVIVVVEVVAAYQFCSLVEHQSHIAL